MNIIVMQQGNKIECFGSLIEICKKKPALKYNTLRYKKYPYTYKGIEFRKLEYREEYGINPKQ
jgi:hypothetical protein